MKTSAHCHSRLRGGSGYPAGALWRRARRAHVHRMHELQAAGFRELFEHQRALQWSAYALRSRRLPSKAGTLYLSRFFQGIIIIGRFKKLDHFNK